MDLDSEKPSQSISNASQKCSDLFESCILQKPDSVAEFEVTTRRFTAWTNRLRVFSQSASLDERLRAEKYDEIRQIVMNLLNALSVLLSHGTQFVITQYLGFVLADLTYV